MSKADIYTRQWITENAIEEISQYQAGVLTIRGLHYRLVARGMINTLLHYKRVVQAMIKARWDGVVEFKAFSDHDRSMLGFTKAKETDVDDKINEGKTQVGLWMRAYEKNRWENQVYYPEVFIEKKALQGVFKPVCNNMDVSLGACKGYPSLTFLDQAADRFKVAEQMGKIPIILYFGDYDPSGEDIPRSIGENLRDMGVEVEIRRIALMEDQVVDWGLPPAPTKVGDSRTAKWSGLGQVELDAVEPKKIQRLCEEAIAEIFDEDLYAELKETEAEEREQYRAELKKHVKEL